MIKKRLFIISNGNESQREIIIVTRIVINKSLIV